ncbi:MAG: transposase [Methylobacter sp.]
MKSTAPTDTAKPNPARRPQDWRPEERLRALQESHGLSGEALNTWCRERGVFAHQLAQWKTEFCTATSLCASREESQNLRTLKAENQRLERELNRKEKALAEAALLILQKKVRALLGARPNDLPSAAPNRDRIDSRGNGCRCPPRPSLRGTGAESAHLAALASR